MAQPYFRYVPNFNYVSRLPGSTSISDYIQVKNLFKRAKIDPHVLNDLSFFTKYKIIGNERPDNIAFKVYGDQYLDWLVMIGNNMINPINEWPLSQESFQNYLMSKYGSETKLYEIHHHETIEIKNSLNQIIIKQGLEVPSDYQLTYYDYNLQSQKTITNATSAVTNYAYEEKIQNDRRNIYLIKPRYTALIINQLEKLMPYRKGSSQYFNRHVLLGDNIRLYQ